MNVEYALNDVQTMTRKFFTVKCHKEKKAE